MMLAASPFYSHPIYMPSSPSPLAVRSANVPSRPFTFTMAVQPHTGKAPIPQRAHKPNPVIQSRDAVTQRRRDMFFRRVQKDRDDKKWDTRGDQIQRLDFISTQKRWEAEKARQAPELQPEYQDEENYDLPTSSYNYNFASHPEQEMEEAEYILAQEEYELQQLIASMEEEQVETMSQHYGSDDEDYDRIFMECTTSTDAEQQIQSTNFADLDAMDMTDG